MSRQLMALGSGLLMCAMLSGCATQPELNYRPQPAGLEYQFGGAGSAHVLARVSGVGERERGEGRDPQPVMIVQMRVTNRSQQPLRLNAEDIELVATNLRQFPSPVLDPQAPVAVPPNESRLVTAVFHFSSNIEPDEEDLDRVQLAVTLRQDDQSITRSAMFQDIEYHRYYYRPYPSRWATHLNVYYGM